MNIEDRITDLEIKEQELSRKIQILENLKNDQWVTPKQLSGIMNCSVNNIYIKLRSGEIYGTKKLGAILRIPMSQFYSEKQEKLEQTKKVSEESEESIKKRVFGFD